jgi:hypothetical protein
MKTIIQRKLPLTEHYTLIDKKYIPLTESCGIGCDNCGQLIANIATVKTGDKVYQIGFDCLETILINNQLLSGKDIAEYEAFKKMLPKILRFAKKIKDTMRANAGITNITGIKFDKPLSEFYPFYWLQNNQVSSRDNDFIKMKDVELLTVITTLKNIFPNLTFVAP